MDGLLDINEAWDDFCDGNYNEDISYDNINQDKNTYNDIIDSCEEQPVCSDIYISTQTKISYLNKNIDLKDVFWKIPILPYHIQKQGILKKQMKFSSSNSDDVEMINKLCEFTKDKYRCNVEKQTITHIENKGRIKYKDVCKINIGLSKKDITSYKCKKKGAFYNCFVIILRIKDNDIFKEIHVKVFNTGKMEIPGIKNNLILNKTLTLVTEILQPYVKNEPNKQLNFIPESTETVLINSNFSCGYYINREKLYNILKYNYKINTVYDPCSYPGIQCEFYYNKLIKEQNGRQEINVSKKNIIKISFMIFRTGSVLIVGKCCENILIEVYKFIRQLLEHEYKNIGGKLIQKEKKKDKKVRKKIINIHID